jgi:hypothetical protein
MNVHPYAELMHEYHTAGDDDQACDVGSASGGDEAVKVMIDDDNRMDDRGGDEGGNAPSCRSIGSIDKVCCDGTNDKSVRVDSRASIINIRPPTTLVIDVSDNSYHPINHLPSSTVTARSPRNGISGISGFSWLQSLFTSTTNALFNFSFPSHHSHDSSSLDDEHSTVGRLVDR